MFNDTNEPMPKVVLINQSKVLIVLIKIINILKKYRDKLTLIALVSCYITFTSFICWKTYNSAFQKGLVQGARTTWDQKAQIKTAALNSFLDHYTLEYRLSGNLDSIGPNLITITKDNTTKTFNIGRTTFILGNKNLSVEDNMFATPSSQIRQRDIKSIFQPGDKIIIVSRVYNVDKEPIVTQIIKYKK